MRALITTIDQEFESLEKARVKPFIRTRRGHLERVGGYERRGEKKTPTKTFAIGEKVIIDYYDPEDNSRWVSWGKIMDPEVYKKTYSRVSRQQDRKINEEIAKVKAGKGHLVSADQGMLEGLYEPHQVHKAGKFTKISDYKKSKEYQARTDPRKEKISKEINEKQAFRIMQDYLRGEPGSPMLKKLKSGGYKDIEGDYVSPKQLIKWAKQIERESQ